MTKRSIIVIVLAFVVCFAAIAVATTLAVKDSAKKAEEVTAAFTEADAAAKTELKADIAALQADLDELEASLADKEAELKALLTAAKGELQGNITALDTKLSTEITNVKNKQTADSTRITTLETKATDLQNQIDQLKSQIAAVNTVLNGTPASGSTAAVPGLKDRLADLENKMTQVETALNDATNGLKKKVSDIETNLNDATNGLNKLVTDARADIAQLKLDVDAAEEDIADLQEADEAINNRIDEFEEEVEATWVAYNGEVSTLIKMAYTNKLFIYYTETLKTNLAELDKDLEDAGFVAADKLAVYGDTVTVADIQAENEKIYAVQAFATAEEGQSYIILLADVAEGTVKDAKAKAAYDEFVMRLNNLFNKYAFAIRAEETKKAIKDKETSYLDGATDTQKFLDLLVDAYDPETDLDDEETADVDEYEEDVVNSLTFGQQVKDYFDEQIEILDTIKENSKNYADVCDAYDEAVNYIETELDETDDQTAFKNAIKDLIDVDDFACTDDTTSKTTTLTGNFTTIQDNVDKYNDLLDYAGGAVDELDTKATHIDPHDFIETQINNVPDVDDYAVLNSTDNTADKEKIDEIMELVVYEDKLQELYSDTKQTIDDDTKLNGDNKTYLNKVAEESLKNYTSIVDNGGVKTLEMPSDYDEDNVNSTIEFTAIEDAVDYLNATDAQIVITNAAINTAHNEWKTYFLATRVNKHDDASSDGDKAYNFYVDVDGETYSEKLEGVRDTYNNYTYILPTEYDYATFTAFIADVLTPEEIIAQKQEAYMTDVKVVRNLVQAKYTELETAWMEELVTRFTSSDATVTTSLVKVLKDQKELFTSNVYAQNRVENIKSAYIGFIQNAQSSLEMQTLYAEAINKAKIAGDVVTASAALDAYVADTTKVPTDYADGVDAIVVTEKDKLDALTSAADVPTALDAAKAAVDAKVLENAKTYCLGLLLIVKDGADLQVGQDNIKLTAIDTAYTDGQTAIDNAQTYAAVEQAYDAAKDIIQNVVSPV